MHLSRTRLGASLAIACAILASGCAGITSHLPAPAPVLASTSLDEKAMVAAEGSYNVVVHSYNVAKPHLSPALRAQLRPLLKKAHDARLAVEAAYDAGNAADFNAQLKALTTAVADVRALVPS